MTSATLATLCAVGAALGNLAGGALVVSQFLRAQRTLTYFVAFGGGFMLAAALLRMVPESMRLSSDSPSLAPAMFLVGYFVTHFFQHVLGEHIHLGAEPHDPHHECDDMSALTLVGLCVHAAFDGVAIASGFAVSVALGALLFIAVLLHKIPEGSTIASVLLHAGHGPATAMLGSLILAVATIVGAVLMTVAPGTLLPYGLPFATGVTIHVAASDLIPEVNELRGIRMALVVTAGAMTFWLTEIALSRFEH